MDIHVYNNQIFRQTCDSNTEIRTNLTKSYSQTDICADYGEFQRDAPAKDILVLNKSSTGHGTYRLFLELVYWDWCRVVQGSFGN